MRIFSSDNRAVSSGIRAEEHSVRAYSAWRILTIIHSNVRNMHGTRNDYRIWTLSFVISRVKASFFRLAAARISQRKVRVNAPR
jgi:hypothetical protein